MKKNILISVAVFGHLLASIVCAQIKTVSNSVDSSNSSSSPFSPKNVINYQSNGTAKNDKHSSPFSFEDFPVILYESSKDHLIIEPKDQDKDVSAFKTQFQKRVGSNDWKVLDYPRKGRYINDQTWPRTKNDKLKDTTFTRAASTMSTDKQPMPVSTSTAKDVSSNDLKRQVPYKGNDRYAADMIPLAASNTYDVPAAPPSTSNHYEYNPPDKNYESPPEKNYGSSGYRNREKEAEYSNPQNYNNEDYNDNYNGPTQGSGDSYNDPYDNNYPPSSEEYKSPNPPTKQYDNYERERPTYSSRPSYSRPYRQSYSRPVKYRSQYPLFSSSSFSDLSDWESPSEKGWLSSLFGGYKYRPSRLRNPFSLSSTEAIPISAFPPGFFDTNQIDTLSLLGTPNYASTAAVSPVSPVRSSSWFSYLRPMASNARPSYSFGGLRSLYGYSPRMPSPPPAPGPAPYPMPYYGYGNMASASSYVPISVRPMGPPIPPPPPPMMPAPSMTNPVKVPFPYMPGPPFMPGRPPMMPFPPFKPLFPGTDLSFAESLRKANATENLEAAAAQNLFAFAVPPPKAMKRVDKNAFREQKHISVERPNDNSFSEFMKNNLNTKSSEFSTISSSEFAKMLPQVSQINPRSADSNQNQTWIPLKRLTRDAKHL